ncbi:MAG: hypothetical protein LZF86_190166 [Nitrospira sp.]|nr:MAG: hypothetical protein LZF86_190166 [Nitrospira sp.]
MEASKELDVTTAQNVNTVKPLSGENWHPAPP